MLRALDHARLTPRELPQRQLAQLATLDADCAEALWAFDQPSAALDRRAVTRDTRASLAALPAVRAQIRRRLPADARARLETQEPLIRATLDPNEAYHDVPGRDPQNR